MEHKIFRQVRNDEKDIKAVADGYKTKIGHELWLVEGLQKDAIQNSWDARTDKKHGRGWECGFCLKEVGHQKILCIIDRGTDGLNGTRFTNEEELVKILNTNKPEENLAYFLNSNWSAKSGEEGGRRGRGKILFLAASQDKKIFFDSLRSSDNQYVFGELYLDTDKQIKFKIFYGQDGKDAFENRVKGKIPSIRQHGTRIFVVNPDPIIERAIKSGEILSFVGYSWWEVIKKYQARIFIENGGEKKYVTLPHWYEDKSENENARDKELSHKEFPSELIKEGTQYRIKRLVLRYAPQLDLPEAIKGIAIQRGGMTIQRLRAENLVREEGMNDIYGWIEMDDKSSALRDQILAFCEGPEHLDFNWTINPAKYLRDYIRSRLREFAKDLKLIEPEQAKKNKIQRSAEEEALSSLKPFFKKLGLFGKRIGGRKKRKKSKRSKDEPLRLSVSDFRLPRESKRINYGEKIEGAYVIPINDLKRSFIVLVRVFIVSEDGRTNIIKEAQINLKPGSGPKIGKDSVTISKSDYKKGGYSFRARMISLEDTDEELPDGSIIEKGTILYDRVNKKFYIETTSPESGPFRFQSRPIENKNILFEWEPEDEGYIIYYNDLHPKIKPISEDEKKLSSYLTEQGALIALQIALEESMAEGKSADKDFSRLIKAKDKDLSGVLPLFLRKYSEFLWDYLKE